MGDYGIHCHGTAHEGAFFGGRHTGEVHKQVAPYQIPYGTLVPKQVENLLVPVAASSSHLGLCALRYEPIRMSLGEAAGQAAHVALDHGCSVQKVPVREVQDRLHRSGAATIYVSDVPPDSASFVAVQWWGARGGLHGIAPPPEKPGQRGKHLRGQYYHAFPGHAVGLDQPMSKELKGRWLKLAGELKSETAPLEKAKTRGEFIRQAHRSANRR